MLRSVNIVRERLTESLAAFRGAFSNPSLRRLQLAGAGSVMGQWAYSVALAVYAYEHGGPKAVGLVFVIRSIPSALAMPFTSTLADRLPRIAVMATSSLARVATIGAAGAVIEAGGPRGLVFTLVGITSILGTPFLPAESAALPELARTPEELTAANVVRSTIDSVGTFAGPAIGGVILAATGAGVVFFVTAGTFLWSGLLVASIRAGGRAAIAAEPTRERRGNFLRQATEGFRSIAVERGLRIVVSLYAAQTLVAGALGVLVVITALDLLDRGKAAVGYLNGAIGVGGLVGAVVAFALVGRRRLAADFGLGVVLWGAPLVLIGAWPNTPVALVSLAVMGLGNTLVDVAGLTLLQRTASPDVIARVFGVLQMALIVTIGLGAVIAPLLVAWVGIRWSLVITGGFLPVLAALAWRRLLMIDAATRAPGPELELLTRIPLFAPLPGPALERLASQLESVHIEAGTPVVTQGEAGDRFYVVADGELDVTIDDRPVGSLGPGDHFGEIALLRDVPRTATVAARTDARLYALDREAFLEAVTSSPPSARAADAVVGARLGAARPAFADVLSEAPTHAPA
jgi:MFS family permease